MESVLATNLQVRRWEETFFDEYIRDGRFKPYMGTDEFSMIQLKEDLESKTGKDLTITLINRLTGAGVTGKTALEGNEEAMVERTFNFSVDRVRHAVLHDRLDEQYSPINLVTAKRSIIKNWFMEKMRDEIITAFGSVPVAGSTAVAYASASEAQKDAMLVDNADRMIFGATVSNASSNDHSTSLANIDNTTDKLTGALVSLARRRARTANPKIRPIKVDGDEEWYVLFANSLSFRDFSLDTPVQQANRDAALRGRDNPLFTGGDLIWDGVIVREVPDIGVLPGVGAAGIQVGPNYLCGAQCLGIAWAQRTKMIENVRDYGAKKGAGAEEIRDIKKLLFGKGAGDRDDLVQHGLHTIFSAAVADV